MYLVAKFISVIQRKTGDSEKENDSKADHR
jgi:hypothetical protein